MEEVFYFSIYFNGQNAQCKNYLIKLHNSVTIHIATICFVNASQMLVTEYMLCI